MFTAWLQRHSPFQIFRPPPPSPLLFPQISLLKRRGRSGAHSMSPRVERAVHGRHGACVARQAHRRSVAGFPPLPPSACVSVTATCKKRAVVESSCHRLCVSHEHTCSRSSGAVSRTPARAIAMTGIAQASRMAGMTHGRRQWRHATAEEGICGPDLMQRSQQVLRSCKSCRACYRGGENKPPAEASWRSFMKKCV